MIVLVTFLLEPNLFESVSGLAPSFLPGLDRPLRPILPVLLTQRDEARIMPTLSSSDNQTSVVV